MSIRASFNWNSIKIQTYKNWNSPPKQLSVGLELRCFCAHYAASFEAETSSPQSRTKISAADFRCSCRVLPSTVLPSSSHYFAPPLGDGERRFFFWRRSDEFLSSRHFPPVRGGVMSSWSAEVTGGAKDWIFCRKLVENESFEGRNELLRNAYYMYMSSTAL